jgi:hypothetical protein
MADVCLGKPFQPERKLACDIQNKAKAPAMISKLDRWCNWDNKNRPAIATRINSLSSLLLEDIDSPTKQWFADNLRHLPLPPVTPSTEVESSAYPGKMLSQCLRNPDKALCLWTASRAVLILRLVFTLAFLYLAARVNAGSAVAWDGDRHLVTSFGHPVEIAKARTLADARFNSWANAKIIGSSNVTGYGAVAVAPWRWCTYRSVAWESISAAGNREGDKTVSKGGRDGRPHQILIQWIALGLGSSKGGDHFSHRQVCEGRAERMYGACFADFVTTAGSALFAFAIRAQSRKPGRWPLRFGRRWSTLGQDRWAEFQVHLAE